MRNGYAVAEQSRLVKAHKIEALLGVDVAGRRLLDMGTGSGLLADYFQSRGAIVTAADRSDMAYRSAIPLTRIDGEALQFADGAFDIVILNHVIEHVGGEAEQRIILSEIRRVLKPCGRLYLAVPNKWALMEPHFRLPLLGALPRSLADRFVRLFRGVPEYDCYPLNRADLLALLATAFSSVEDRSDEAVAWVVERELSGIARTVLRAVPKGFFRLARPLYPTFVMVCGARR